MKIIHIDPGAGGTFYCQNCMRDCALVHALRRQGHDVLMVPMYLPILIDNQDISGNVPVFFGGINVYLQQQFAFFRHTPRWLDKLFDLPWMLRLAAKQEGSTEASDLGPLTLSVLEGEDGNQKKELERLIKWIVEQEKPDLIHISNALLLGLAEPLKRALNVPVVCSLQDEQTWLLDMDKAHQDRCWDVMKKHSAHVDTFITVSQWYAQEMKQRLELSDEKLKIVPLGIEVTDTPPPKPDPNPPVLGYLSKLTQSLGLDLLVDAFIQLKKIPELADLQLRATGGLVGPDIAFVEALRKKLAAAGLEADTEFIEDFDPDKRSEFLNSLHLLSVPSPRGEAFGMFLLESMAVGVPVVQPQTGGYAEVIEATQGGIVYDHNDPNALVEALKSLLLDPEKCKNMGETGRNNVTEHFSIDHMAKEIATLYESLA